MINNTAGYYPLDRLALILEGESEKVVGLMWLSSRWGTFSLQDGRWVEETPNQFRYKGRTYIHLNSEKFAAAVFLYKKLKGEGFREDFSQYQVIYEFEFREMFDVSMDKDGVRDAYEIYRWVNEFTDPSPVELAGEECHRAKYYSFYVDEIVEPEIKRESYEKEILNKRSENLEEKVNEKLSWIEGLPALNTYLNELYSLADNRHELHEIAQDYEDEWPYDANLNAVRGYMSGSHKLSIREQEELAQYCIKRYIDFIWPFPKVVYDVISKPDEQ